MTEENRKLESIMESISALCGYARNLPKNASLLALECEFSRIAQAIEEYKEEAIERYKITSEL